MSDNVFYIGLDLGSVSFNAVVTDDAGNIVFKMYKRVEGRPFEAALSVFRVIRSEFGSVLFSGGYIDGSGKDLLGSVLGIPVVNEIVAHATAAWSFFPDVKSVFEIGGQDSKFISIGCEGGHHFIADHVFNELCAAGTGAFLDQQAGRLGISVSELGDLAFSARNVSSVAGRCSVFAKSDMIHLQQKATPTDEIAAGLCYALARNYVANMCKGRKPLLPILFQGGVAANRGVVRAFKDILSLDDGDFIVPEHFNVMGALGSAFIAMENPFDLRISIDDFIALLENVPDSVSDVSDLMPLCEKFSSGGGKSLDVSFRAPYFMGIDVGSVSTKGVVVDSLSNIAAFSYGPTAGNPVSAVRVVADELKSKLGKDFSVSHVVFTGSGRHLAKSLFGGGSVIDEISAQWISSARFFSDVDTIIEIGGQDSKFISLKDGKIDSFKMNRACAAGTGSFLEEQAGRLNVDIKGNFQDMAFASAHPVRLGSRCTVFMDSDLVHHLQRGALIEDLCAGLSYSIAENYIEKVVGSSKFGEKIVFQGGVAKNRALHAVFESLLERNVYVHPFPEISGALGASFVAMDEFSLSEGGKSFAFKLGSVEIDACGESFECHGCENLCEIRKITVADGGVSYFGSVCGRFENGTDVFVPADDLFSVRERLLFDNVIKSDSMCHRGKIGVPFTLTMCDHLPFWGTFFNKLGFETVLSGKSSRDIVAKGLLAVPAEFCYPMKVLFGHVFHLADMGIERIFIPQLKFFNVPDESGNRYACAYTQAAPFIVRENAPEGVDVFTLEFPVDGEHDFWVKMCAENLGIDVSEIWSAFDFALNAQKKFASDCLDEGRNALKRLQEEGRRGALIIGRPYNTTDRYVNLNLARRLKKLDIEPFPFDFIPLDEVEMPHLWDRIRWGYGRRLVKSARALKKYDFMGGVIVTNFGCGPDAFVDQYLEHELRGVPNILLEFDDHQAEAGLVTRLEAFSRSFNINSGAKISVEGKDPGKPRIPLREYTYYIPSFMDHAYALTGALKGSGCKAVLLPPTDDESWNLGLKYAYGRECHPFISFTGDLLKAAKRDDFIPEKACYFGPSYFGPCLLPQYPLALHLILERVGLSDVTVMNLTDETNMKELGIGYLLKLILGLYTVDRFFKWKTEIEPYELKKGSVKSVYKEVLELVESGLAEGGLTKKIKKGVEMLSSVPLSEKNGERAKIGIIGDVYTRINEHSNNYLYQRLEKMGYEVWTSCSMIDISFLGAEQMSDALKRKGKNVKSVFAKLTPFIVKKLRWFVDRNFPDSVRTPQEGDYKSVSETSSKYADYWIDRSLSANIGRIEEFEKAGADGIINVMCHNCMLGTVTESLSKSIRRDMNDIPLCTLVYEGLKSTHNVNRLEAFTHQVSGLRKVRKKI